MCKTAVLSMFAMAAMLRGQYGQAGARSEWPCVAGRAVDPSYLEVSESTGGQLILFQKGEAAQTSIVMSATSTHPATVLRSVGHLNGTRDFEFPVDSGIESFVVLASIQCRSAIQVTRPGGAEMTEANSAQSAELRAGRILRVERPEAGPWRVRLTGSGLFILSVLAKTQVSLSGLTLSPEQVRLRLSGEVTNLKLRAVDAEGNAISDEEALEAAEGGGYRSGLHPRGERFRLLVTGTDGAAWPFQRMGPILYRAERVR
jgi:hypothetical protein